MEQETSRPLAVVTGASSGIGFELAKQFAEHDYAVLMCAEDQAIEEAAAALRALGAPVTALWADLATPQGVEQLAVAAEAAGPPEAVAINAGIAVAGPFVETPLEDDLTLIQLNVTSAVHLAKRLLPGMVQRGSGGVLFTSSVAATMPGPYYATYAASKAFVQSFAEAIRHELKDSGVTVTALMPGPTDTEFFERAGMEDTKVGQGPKDDPADVAKDGFEALMKGKDKVLAGSSKSTLQAAASRILPDKARAATHATMTKPQDEE